MINIRRYLIEEKIRLNRLEYDNLQKGLLELQKQCKHPNEIETFRFSSPCEYCIVKLRKLSCPDCGREIESEVE